MPGGRSVEELQLEIREYLRENMGIYIVIVALFVAGVIAGSLIARGLDEDNRLLLNQYFNLLVEKGNGAGLEEQSTVLGQSLKTNFQFLFLTWGAGIFSFGFPLVLLLVGIRGFSVGFTVAFLVNRAAFRGMLFAMGSVLPHNLILIPAQVVIAATGFSFSWLRFRRFLERRPSPIREHLGPYTLMIFFMGLVLFLGCLVEAYISPVFVRLLIPVLND